jgi:hypothetical protein
MIEDLQRRGLSDQDAGRVSEAFNILGGKIQKWPTPLMVIEALPKRVVLKFPWLEQKIKRTKEADEIESMLHAALRKGGKKISVMLPGEGLGDYLKAYERSGLGRQEFDRQRLERNAKAIDPEAEAERAAITSEGE